MSSSNWIPCSLSGDDLPGSMSISKIAKFIILPLADCAISIMAISMYQSDYIMVRTSPLFCENIDVATVQSRSVSV